MSSDIASCNLGRMFFTRNASISPFSKAFFHGCSIKWADLSDGCQLIRAELNFCLMMGKMLTCRC